MADLKNLDAMNFMKQVKTREMTIAAAPSDIPHPVRPANALAESLHPEKQYFVVSEVISHSDTCKSYILIPDTEKGTTHCAFFSAGQYISVETEIDGRKYYHPYTISSSPADALNGKYRITIKLVPNGFISENIINTFKVGTKVTASSPLGTFTYEPLRDEKQIVGIAGGSGITPFVSLAHAIADGDEDCSLTLFYCCHSEADVLFKDELSKIESSCDKVKVIYIITESEGHLTADTIKQYVSGEFSVFVCGSGRLYEGMENELAKLSLKRKQIRLEVHSDGAKHAEAEVNNPTFTVICRGNTTTFKGDAEKTVLANLEENGIAPPVRCRSGECGFCRSRLVSGKVTTPTIDKRRRADESAGYFHPCCTFPLTDIIIEVTKG